MGYRHPIPTWSILQGKPYVTVSAKGIANGLSTIINDGADFGVDTVGTTTSGIQEAINTGNPVKLGAGNFVISNTITIPSHTVVDGMGEPLTNITYNGVNSAILIPEIASQGNQNYDNYLSNFSITLNSATGIGIEGQSVAESVFRNIYVVYPGLYGFYFHAVNGNGATHVLFQHCHVESKFGTTTPTAFAYGGPTGINAINDAIFMGCIAHEQAIGFFIGAVTSQVTIMQPHLEDITEREIVIGSGAGSQYVNVSDVTIITPSSVGFTGTSPQMWIQNDARNVTIIGGYATSDIQSDFQPTAGSYPAGSVCYIGLVDYSGIMTNNSRSLITLGTNPPVSGTVYQNTYGADIEINLPVYATTAGTAGYVTVAKGASSTPTTIGNQFVNGSTSSTSTDIIKIVVPAGWYYEFTSSGVTFGTTTVFGI